MLQAFVSHSFCNVFPFILCVGLTADVIDTSVYY